MHHSPRTVNQLLRGAQVVSLVVEVDAIGLSQDRVGTPQTIGREQVEVGLVALPVQFSHQALVGVDIPGGFRVFAGWVINSLADSSSEGVIAVFGNQLVVVVADGA